MGPRPLGALNMSLNFRHIEFLRVEEHRKIERNQRFLWADAVGLMPLSVGIFCFTALLGLSLSAIWVQSPASDFAVRLCTIFYLLVSTLRIAACLTPRPKDPQTTPEIWPSYSVLVPLYDEPDIAQELITHLSKLEYPRDKLDITLICEREDHVTVSALWSYLKNPFSLAIVAPGGPKTKPNALNYALERTKSDLVTIYDAEDRPHPQQLKMAAAAFAAHPEWAALQAPLTFYNAKQNWLTRQFALEYAALFYVWVPFLSRLKCPFPLGGTSNHIRREALDLIGGWDGHNVTEDADLSFRLSLLGQKIGYISVPTKEEVVSDWKSWSGQRSRWMKGYMQTFNLHMYTPFDPGGITGLLRFITLQITLGVTLVTGFCHLPFLLVLSFAGFSSLLFGQDIFAPSIYTACLAYGYASGVLCAWVGAIRSEQSFLIKHTLWMPGYWLALFLPTLRAAVELKRRPFYWHKTQHGSPVEDPVALTTDFRHSSHPV